MADRKPGGARAADRFVIVMADGSGRLRIAERDPFDDRGEAEMVCDRANSRAKIADRPPVYRLAALTLLDDGSQAGGTPEESRATEAAAPPRLW
jgi:hypothetical protein